MKNIVYFDLETQKSAEEVGGWGNISRMGMSVGVIYSVGQGAYKIFGEKQVERPHHRIAAGGPGGGL